MHWLVFFSFERKGEKAMMNCEENSCENFQSAICLHCMRALCLLHIENHQRSLLAEMDQFQNEANQISGALVDASKKIAEEQQVEEKKWNEWYQRQMGYIEREYQTRINSIHNRQKTLEQLQVELQQRFQTEIQQPLEQISMQKSVNPRLLDLIRSAIQTLKHDTKSLTWKSNAMKDANPIHHNEKSSDGDNASSSTIPKRTRTRRRKIQEWKPKNLLFSLFRDVGPQSAKKIKEFVQVNNQTFFPTSRKICATFRR